MDKSPSCPGGAPFLPLSGIRVVEFSQMVMGPTCGVILADLGADIVKVEPLKGDRSRTSRAPRQGSLQPTVATRKASPSTR